MSMQVRSEKGHSKDWVSSPNDAKFRRSVLA